MRGLWLLLVAGCADPPTATVRFAPLGDPDNCAASESAILSQTSAIWLGLQEEGVTVADRCFAIDGIDTWDAVEDVLVQADLLIEELPLNEGLDLLVMGLPAPATCPEGEPVGAVRFCGRSSEPVLIRGQGRSDIVEVLRICPENYSAQDCFEVR
ncbi:MAG: hypothetical protein HYY06_12310 [Deltaproteobacteria bacterium]|nr:hypothetical protein [Deltaproteobacteria bacterium]